MPPSSVGTTVNGVCSLSDIVGLGAMTPSGRFRRQRGYGARTAAALPLAARTWAAETLPITITVRRSPSAAVRSHAILYCTVRYGPSAAARSPQLLLTRHGVVALVSRGHSGRRPRIADAVVFYSGVLQWCFIVVSYSGVSRQVRSAHDPMLAAMRLTGGTLSFGRTRHDEEVSAKAAYP